ncbi:LytR/AlgR family response regulator transcription factor [Bergeyella cardium]|uniref:Response regulator n=1 Tax=Bergeyella cardium TaxID=1585976 RepID=A0A6P1QT93_9FLAO|nr:LytTR family DNA-binding domain-containing protein [Bergeyella cardium]QHN64407.1 response regulator [Bergeyella cardium]WHE33696.1 LytTR family DNA-binding domain-containing protein [Bergeyella cardium]WHF60346.1 LytTR family DNA-binding domain-containing protein [Bergeyella cardium]
MKEKTKTLIIEDEKPAARHLSRMLSERGDIELIGIVHSVKEGLNFLKNQSQPDLIFADIVLGDGLSFDIFEKTELRSFIIYTTAFDNYTLRAFKLNSVDYLLKPITKEELHTAIEKYHRFSPKAQHYENLNFSSMITTEAPKISRILSKTGTNLKIIPTSDISFFYSENKIVYAQTKERSYPTDFSLDELENNLPSPSFFRINRQTIIHIHFIKNICTSPTYSVQMLYSLDPHLSISRDRINDFKNWLTQS